MTRQQAINAKCKDCIYDPMSEGTWRQQTGACIDTACALHEYRPRSTVGRVPTGNPQPEWLKRKEA